jgi:hypothetical protein
MVAFLESVFIFEPGAGDPASRDKADYSEMAYSPASGRLVATRSILLRNFEQVIARVAVVFRLTCLDLMT